MQGQTRDAFEARILLAFAAAIIVVAALSTIVWKVASDATEAARGVAHTHEVLNNLTRTHADTLQIELSTQGYRISGDLQYIAERNKVVADREMLLERLRNQTADNPRQQQHWGQLRQVVDERLAISRRVEQIRKTQGQEAAQAFVSTSPLQETRGRIYRILGEMDEEERQLLQARNVELLSARQNQVIFGTLVSILLAALLAATYLLVLRQLRETQASRLAHADSEESLSITLQSIGDAVMATDNQGRITRMNRVAEQLTGWPFAEAQGRHIHEVFCIINELTRSAAEIPVEKVLATGEIHEIANHTLLIARDRTEFPIADSAAPIRDASGEIRGVVIVFRNETISRQAKQTIQEQNKLLEQHILERTTQLNESESHLRSVINSVPALIAYVDARQRYVYVNTQYRERFAPGKEDITGYSVAEILGKERYEMAGPLIEKVLQGEPQSYDWQPFPDIWQQINYVPKRDEQGLVVGYYVLGTEITERRHTEQALRDSEQRLARVLEGSDQGYWDWNLKTNAFQVSARWETMLGFEPGEMRVDTVHWPELVHPDDFPLALESIERHLSGQASSHEAEFRCKTKDGGWRWILTRGSIVSRADDGSPIMMSGTHTDITERKQFELAQREAAVVFENSYEAIMVANADGRITKVNPAFTRITGYEESEVTGCSPRILSSDHHDAQFYDELWDSLDQNGFWRGEVWNRRKNGEIFASLESISAVRDVKGQIRNYVSVFADISQLKAHEIELDRVANYDSLTELPNRRLLSDRLNQSILRAARSGKSMVVCFLDLDGFKVINDQYGHSTGDQLLVRVAEQLKLILRADDTLARLGGDEFVILLSEVASPEECTLILDRILQTVRHPVVTNEHQVSISASIGVSLYPADNADPDTLLRHADQAMYLAKQAGKNRYQLFDPENDRIAQNHRDFLDQLRQALKREEFVLFYQPKVDLVNGEVIGAEALIRWQHPERGLLPPAEFLPHLHGSELEQAFGEWVIETALSQMEAWAAAGLQIKVSVNVSANHLLQSDFSARLGLSLSRHPTIKPKDLELEVLETAAIGDMKQAVEILQQCMALGVSFSLDDFGTGYSSLTYLRKLPVNTLKIDQSFVRDMLTDSDDLGIVQGVIQLASTFERQVIAEGVETLEHGAVLRQMGCRFVQGYGIAKPMPADQLPPWCKNWIQGEAWCSI